MTDTIKHYSITILLLILFFAFNTRMYRLAEPSAYVFDEVYHALTAKLIARNHPAAYEWWHSATEPNSVVEPNTAIDWLHPPLAKYTQALSIRAFGENSFGWRFSSAIFGVLAIAATYWLTQELFGDERVSLLAAGLASLDGLLLVQSRVAMNDIHVTFLILVTLTLYWKFRQKWARLTSKASWRFDFFSRETWQVLKYLVLSGLMGGLAMGTKWSGFFVVLTLVGFEALRIMQVTCRWWYNSAEAAALRKRFKSHKRLVEIFPSFSHFLLMVTVTGLSLLLLPVVIYVLSYAHMFIQGKSFICSGPVAVQGECYVMNVTTADGSSRQKLISHFHELHNQIWWYQTNLKATHDYQSRPLQWFFNLRPVWFHVRHFDNGTVANIYAQGNPLLFWIGGATVLWSVLFFVHLVLKAFDLPESLEKIGEYIPLGYVLIGYFMVWLPWQFSPRIMFFYHYTPAVPLMCIILSYWLVKVLPFKLNRQPLGQYLVGTILGLIAAVFVLWYPNWTAIPVPEAWANAVYFALPSWK